MLEYRVLLHSGPLDFLQNAIDGLSSLRPSITMWSLLRLRWTRIWPRPNPRSGANLERIFDFCVFLLDNKFKKSYSQGQIKADYRQPEATPPHCEPIQLCSLRRSLSLVQERANLGCKNISRPIYFFLSSSSSLSLQGRKWMQMISCPKVFFPFSSQNWIIFGLLYLLNSSPWIHFRTNLFYTKTPLHILLLSLSFCTLTVHIAIFEGILLLLFSPSGSLSSEPSASQIVCFSSASGLKKCLFCSNVHPP